MFPRLVQTASVWIRGILLEEFDISPQRTGWHAASVHHWEEGTPSDDLRPRDGSVIRRIDTKGKNEAEGTDWALREGVIDALGTTRLPRSFVEEDERVKRLFENYREVEASYYRKTKIFPIMHVLVIRKAAIEKHPEVPAKLFDLFFKCQRTLEREAVETVFQEKTSTLGFNDFLEKVNTWKA